VGRIGLGGLLDKFVWILLNLGLGVCLVNFQKI